MTARPDPAATRSSSLALPSVEDIDIRTCSKSLSEGLIILYVSYTNPISAVGREFACLRSHVSGPTLSHHRACQKEKAEKAPTIFSSILSGPIEADALRGAIPQLHILNRSLSIEDYGLIASSSNFEEMTTMSGIASQRDCIWKWHIDRAFNLHIIGLCSESFKELYRALCSSIETDAHYLSLFRDAWKYWIKAQKFSFSGESLHLQVSWWSIPC